MGLVTAPGSAAPWVLATYWGAVGGLVAFGVAGLASIGLFLLALAAVLVAVAVSPSPPCGDRRSPASSSGCPRPRSTSPGSTAVARAWSAPPTAPRPRASTRGARGRSSPPACCWPAAGSACSPRPGGGRGRCPGRRSRRWVRRLARRLGDRDCLSRPRGDHPDAAGRARGPDGAVRTGRQPLVAAHLRARRARRRRGGARAHRRRAGCAAVRGRLHLRGNRVRQPRREGRLARPPARSTRPSTASSRAASSTTRCSTRSSTSPWPAGCGSPGSSRTGAATSPSTASGRRWRPAGVAVASVMWANNEVGTVQPVAELAAVAREHGVPFHTDAVQAVAHLPVRFDESGADLMTVSAHKIGGPVGRRRPPGPPRRPARARSPTVADRSGRCAAARSTRPASTPSRSRSRRPWRCATSRRSGSWCCATGCSRARSRWAWASR